MNDRKETPTGVRMLAGGCLLLAVGIIITVSTLFILFFLAL